MKDYMGFIYVEEATGIYIGVVPDLNFTTTNGHTFEATKKYLQEACELYVDDINENEYPEVSDLNTLLKIEDLPKKNVIVYIQV